MTHQILMLTGPDAIEFNAGKEQNFGNFYTWSEFQLYNAYFFIQDPTFQYYCLYFGISILGYISSDIFYSFHLLDVIQRFKTLQDVIKSITSNATQLGLTCLLLVIIVYIFTSLTFFYIQEGMHDYAINPYDSDIVGENICPTMFQCFIILTNYGLRSEGGIGDFAIPLHFLDETENFMIRLVHDQSFLMLLKIIMLNVLFGIIIDTFAQLRDENTTKKEDMLNVCFICNQRRLVFEKQDSQGGMERHI